MLDRNTDRDLHHDRTRPMVVITAAALPNPTIVDYDVLLQYVRLAAARYRTLTFVYQINIVVPGPIRYIHLSTSLVLSTYLPLNTVEADYTVVFLAAGGKHSPGWSWIWRAYRSLSRKYRKNLKKLVRSIATRGGPRDIKKPFSSISSTPLDSPKCSSLSPAPSSAPNSTQR